jgi:hypothetical protein
VPELVPRDTNGCVDFGGYLQHHRHAEPTLKFFLNGSRVLRGCCRRRAFVWWYTLARMVMTILRMRSCFVKTWVDVPGSGWNVTSSIGPAGGMAAITTIPWCRCRWSRVWCTWGTRG